jgi:hypothetical protein
MRDRGISWSDIRAALKDRAIAHPYAGGGLRVYSKAGSKPIIVGIREFPDYIKVVTVMNWEQA